MDSDEEPQKISYFFLSSSECSWVRDHCVCKVFTIQWRWRMCYCILHQSQIKFSQDIQPCRSMSQSKYKIEQQYRASFRFIIKSFSNWLELNWETLILHCFLLWKSQIIRFNILRSVSCLKVRKVNHIIMNRISSSPPTQIQNFILQCGLIV